MIKQVMPREKNVTSKKKSNQKAVNQVVSSPHHLSQTTIDQLPLLLDQKTHHTIKLFFFLYLLFFLIYFILFLFFPRPTGLVPVNKNDWKEQTSHQSQKKTWWKKKKKNSPTLCQKWLGRKKHTSHFQLLSAFDFVFDLIDRSMQSSQRSTLGQLTWSKTMALNSNSLLCWSDAALCVFV